MLRKQKAEPPFFKVARLSSKTRGFPSLSSGRFGFVLYEQKQSYVYIILGDYLAICQWDSVVS